MQAFKQMIALVLQCNEFFIKILVILYYTVIFCRLSIIRRGFDTLQEFISFTKVLCL